jgi:hypothetical protein
MGCGFNSIGRLALMGRFYCRFYVWIFKTKSILVFEGVRSHDAIAMASTAKML